MAVKPQQDHSPRPVDLAAESVAGEEDPGASIELVDAAPPTPAAGGEACPACGGSGRQAGRECPACQGTGRAGADGGAA